MLRKIMLILALICLPILISCSSPETTPPSSGNETAAYQKITAEEAKEKLDAGGVTLVDVRTAEEYAQEHIPGAVLVSNESISDHPPEALPDKDAVVIVYCRTGVRSKQAAEKLVKHGYTQVLDMGGIVDWPYKTEGGVNE